MRPAFGRDGLVAQALLTPFGTTIVLIFAGLTLYLGFELGRAARRRSEERSLFAAYCAFAVTLLNDVAVGAGLIHGAELLPLGYLVMLTGLSAVLVRRFVRSMDEAEPAKISTRASRSAAPSCSARRASSSTASGSPRSARWPPASRTRSTTRWPSSPRT
jgi:hypothetical protein